ncbi:MAG: copper resistance protein CopC [Phenylobacterium sp.]
MRITLILAAAVALIAGQAAAHARLITGSPKAGTTVAAPKELRLTYSESLDLSGSTVKVADAKGAAVATGPLALDPKNKRIAVVPVTGKLGAGAYHVSWTMKTEDGHTTDGDFGFKVK